MSGASPSVNWQIVRAGAGAGKTTALVAKVLNIVEQYRQSEGKFPRLVVTTFTRKATQELRERLTIEACRRGDLELLDYCRSRAVLHISTIHGVLGLFLRRYGHLVGIDPSYTILNETAAQQIRRQSLRKILMDSEVAGKLMEEWSLPRLEELLRQFGEARAMSPEMKPWLKEDILSWQISTAISLASTLKETASEIRAGTSREKWLEYASFSESVAKILLDAWNQETWNQLFQLTADWPNKPPRRGAVESEISIELDQSISEIKSETREWLKSFASSPQYAEAIEEISARFEPLALRFLELVNETKSNQGAIEMVDLEEATLRSVRERPEVAGSFASDWDYWLIDEFQDTSPLQIELINLLAGDRPRYMVGDPQQSIYLFRGARMEIFSEQEAKVKEGGGRAETLSKNYRSRPELVSFINEFLATVGAGFMPLEPRAEVQKPSAIVATFQAASQEEERPLREVEYLGLTAKIEMLLKDKKTELSDICILARKNRSLMDIAQFLKQRGIPTHVHASRGFYDRLEVKDALLLLKFLILPHDNLTFLALLRSPWCRISDDLLSRAIERGSTPYWFQISKGTLANHPVIVALKEARAEADRIGLSAAWEKALIHFGFFDFCNHHDATGRREANVWKLVAGLANAERMPGFQILDFIEQGLAKSNDPEESNEGDAVTAVEPNVVNLMTVHAAKGLQRKHIFIPHCDERMKPRNRSYFAFDEEQNKWSLALTEDESGETVFSPLADKRKQILEERELSEQDRLLYVAVTRAQESVHFSWTGIPKANSWANRWKWPLAEPGVQTRENYSVEIFSGRMEPQGVSVAVEDASAIRTSWREANAWKANTPGVTSVVNLLSETSLASGALKTAAPDQVVSRIQRAVLGTDLHRLLQQLRLNPEMDLERLADKMFLNRKDEVLKAVEYVKGLAHPPMAQLLRHGYAEWGFQVRFPRAILEGQIDLWGQVDGELWLVDYKSGDPAHLAKALSQLEIYAMALRRMGHAQPAQLAVVYPFAKRVEVRRLNADTNHILKKYPSLSGFAENEL